MGASGHYLYRGEIWFKHPESLCTKVLLCSAKTYVGNLCGNEHFPEFLDSMPFLERILGDASCTVIPQLELDVDVIEVLIVDHLKYDYLLTNVQLGMKCIP